MPPTRSAISPQPTPAATGLSGATSPTGTDAGPAFRLVGDLDRVVPWVVTAEHASAALPWPLRASPADAATLASHWAFDLGVAEVVEELVEALPALGILSMVSRLVIDANRAPDHGDAIRRIADDHALSFNLDVDEAEHARRVATYHVPYHDAIDALARAQQRRARDDELRILSVHSFTPVLGVKPRWMEAGVLFDRHDALAERLADALRAQGFATALNEPYSGKDELIYAANRHGHSTGLRYLELELRQDLLATPDQCRDVARRVAVALRALAPFEDPE